MSRRAKRPLNTAAVQAANNQFYANHPELVQDGKRIPLDPQDPAQTALRKEWMDSYVAKGGAIEETSRKQPQTPVQPCPQTDVECVKQITAKTPGTKGKRDATKKRPENTLTASSSKDESLSTNPPVVLIRGSQDVELSAVTTPPNKPVTWTVKPNENTELAPTLTPTDGGRKAILKTDKAGSFSVIATLGACKVVWNVVFAWVKVDVDSSVITSRDNKFADSGSGGGTTSFKSGEFSAGQYAWEAKVKMQVLGGGASQTIGVGKVKIHILQNGVTDTLTGNYKEGGTALEVPKGGLPVVDATDASSPFIWASTAGTVTPANSAVTDTDKSREAWTGDSPAGGFLSVHKNTGKALESISGVNKFATAIASISDDAPNAIVVHAQTQWTADYKGKVNAAGTYTPDGANIAKEAKFSLISSGTGGQDACDAGFETFEPRFNGGTDTTWTP